ncbi:hypothetical protein [Fictibacillus barbaricus]|uniref:hypothetical protein n=1 Tax=Fictibacillus barbaricus TaxID=182136 RepID=UPI001E3036FE|nr:hypothetical protein [Fictibacillus barbaricus]
MLKKIMLLLKYVYIKRHPIGLNWMPFLLLGFILYFDDVLFKLELEDRVAELKFFVIAINTGSFI